MEKLSKKTKIFVTSFAALFVVAFSFLLINIITGRITFGEADAWDGESVASSFSSGNGTLENPYIIGSPEEFLLFKNSIEGEDFKAYQDKYYELSANLNFGNHQISSIGIKEEETERIFKGNFNGNGYTISNLNIIGNNIDNTNTKYLKKYLSSFINIYFLKSTFFVFPLFPFLFNIPSLKKSFDNLSFFSFE